MISGVQKLLVFIKMSKKLLKERRFNSEVQQSTED